MGKTILVLLFLLYLSQEAKRALNQHQSVLLVHFLQVYNVMMTE